MDEKIKKIAPILTVTGIVAAGGLLGSQPVLADEVSPDDVMLNPTECIVAETGTPIYEKADLSELEKSAEVTDSKIYDGVFKTANEEEIVNLTEEEEAPEITAEQDQQVEEKYNNADSEYVSDAVQEYLWEYLDITYKENGSVKNVTLKDVAVTDLSSEDEATRAYAEKYTLDLINYYRVMAGVDPVQLDEESNYYAKAATDYFVAYNEANGKVRSISHTARREDGYSQEDVKDKLGLDYSNLDIDTGLTSNLASWSGDNVTIHQLLRTFINDADTSNSPEVGHRLSILDPDLRYIGISGDFVNTQVETYVTTYNSKGVASTNLQYVDSKVVYMAIKPKSATNNYETTDARENINEKGVVAINYGTIDQYYYILRKGSIVMPESVWVSEDVKREGIDHIEITYTNKKGIEKTEVIDASYSDRVSEYKAANPSKSSSYAKQMVAKGEQGNWFYADKTSDAVNFISNWIYDTNLYQATYTVVTKAGNRYSAEFNGETTIESVVTSIISEKQSANDNVVTVEKEIEGITKYAVNENTDLESLAGMIQEAYHNYELLSEESKAKVSNYSRLVAMDGAVKGESAIRKECSDFNTKVAAIGEVTLESGSQITEAEKAYDQLSSSAKYRTGQSYNKLVAARKTYDEAVAHAKAVEKEVSDFNTQVKNLQPSYDWQSDITDLEAAEKTMSELSDEAKNMTRESIATLNNIRQAYNESLSAHEMKEAAINKEVAGFKVFYEMIDVVDLSTDCKTKIDDAKSCYESMKQEESKQMLASEYENLLEMEQEYLTLKSQKENEQAEAIQNVRKAVDEIFIDHTPESKTSIDTAKSLYDGLDDSLKDDIDVNFSLLYQDQVKAVAEYEQAEDLAAVEKVKQAIDNIYIDSSRGSRNAIVIAKNMYNKLDDDLKEMIDVDFDDLLEQQKKASNEEAYQKALEKTKADREKITAFEEALEYLNYEADDIEDTLSIEADLIKAEKAYSEIPKDVLYKVETVDIEFMEKAREDLDAAKENAEAIFQPIIFDLYYLPNIEKAETVAIYPLLSKYMGLGPNMKALFEETHPDDALKANDYVKAIELKEKANELDQKVAENLNEEMLFKTTMVEECIMLNDVSDIQATADKYQELVTERPSAVTYLNTEAVQNFETELIANSDVESVKEVLYTVQQASKEAGIESVDPDAELYKAEDIFSTEMDDDEVEVVEVEKVDEGIVEIVASKNTTKVTRRSTPASRSTKRTVSQNKVLFWKKRS